MSTAAYDFLRITIFMDEGIPWLFTECCGRPYPEESIKNGLCPACEERRAYKARLKKVSFQVKPEALQQPKIVPLVRHFEREKVKIQFNFI